MNQDSGIPLTQLQVDGGMTSNRLLMQLQADILCIPVGEKHPPAVMPVNVNNEQNALEKPLHWHCVSSEALHAGDDGAGCSNGGWRC